MKIPKPDGKKRIFLCAAAGLLLAGTAVLIISGRGVKAEFTEARRCSVSDWYRENGVLKAGEAYTELSQVGGEILEVPVRVNRNVREGDLIVRIDASDYEYQKQLAEAALEGLRAQLELEKMSQLMTTSPDEYLAGVSRQYESAKAAYEAASSAYEADRTLYSAGDISRVQYETDRAAYESALAAYEAAKKRNEESAARYESLSSALPEDATLSERFFRSEEQQLEAQIASQEAGLSNLLEKIAKCEVRARKNGVILTLEAEKVSAVQPGTVLFTLSEREGGGLFAEADVLTSAAGYLREGSRVEAKLDRRGTKDSWKGAVTEIYSFAEKGTSALGLDEYRVHVRAELEASGDETARLDGYGAELSFCLFEEENALTIPASAAFKEEDRWYVYVPENGRAVQREIVPAYSTGTQIVIGSGLSEGDRVVKNADTAGLYSGVKLK